jgi:uncharacterized membrane protein HdeD (DUF308 family)
MTDMVVGLLLLCAGAALMVRATWLASQDWN